MIDTPGPGPTDSDTDTPTSDAPVHPSASRRVLVYRAMREATNGELEVGPSARTLGVRPNVDIPVTQGLVRPATGGLSVAPFDPANLPAHRRPPGLGGNGKDPVWSIAIDALGTDLQFRQDKPGHGSIE